MDFWEAVKIARTTGKKIRCKAYYGNDEWIVMAWDNAHDVMLQVDQVEGTRTIGMPNIRGAYLNAGWEVVEPPPKEYEFMEAFKMLQEGKCMMCLSNKVTRRELPVAFYSNEILSKWIEVQP